MLPTKLLLALTILPAVVSSQQLSSDTTKIKEVIIQENRLQIPFSQNNRNVQILSKEEIQKLPGISLPEVLRFAAGVDIRQRGAFGTQADIGIDGGSFDQTIILINGVKISDPQTGHHMLNLPIALSSIERIEILRGPASRIYGINGLTGAINIVTTKVDASKIETNAYVGSSFQDVEESDKSGKYYATGLQLSADIYQKDHQHQFFIAKEHSNGQRYNTASDNYKLFYQNLIELNQHNEIQVMAGYMDNKFGANGYYAAPGDIESEEYVKTAISSLSSKHQLNSKFNLSPRLSYRYNEDDYRYYRNDLTKARSRHYTHTLTAELNAAVDLGFGDLGLGLESRLEKINSSNIGDHQRNNWGAYTEFRTTEIKNFLLNIGAYINYNSDYNWQIFPGIDVSYLISDQWKLSASTGSSQRIPTYTDLYLNQKMSNIGNPALLSENSWQNDISLSFNTSKFNSKIGYFYRDIDNFIDWTRSSTTEPYQANNLGNNKTHGIFTQTQYIHALSKIQSISFSINYTYLNPSIINKTNQMMTKYGINSLKHQAQGILSYQYKQIQLSSANRLIQRISGNAYYVADLRLAYQPKKIGFNLDVQNLFNEKYIEIAAVPLPTRWLMFGVQYRI
ncbi:TonB-dependent receptor plug domain-containing protein [Sphingobacterium sp. HJSM2_6]|uniref:TonB-dependent receptor plug domain-containing protein n=1 Tax=Sphingobacterium sp. HJSM2_6 TaxID=3366264 RepID=UPI003BBFF071